MPSNGKGRQFTLCTNHQAFLPKTINNTEPNGDSASFKYQLNAGRANANASDLFCMPFAAFVEPDINQSKYELMSNESKQGHVQEYLSLLRRGVRVMVHAEQNVFTHHQQVHENDQAKA